MTLAGGTVPSKKIAVLTVICLIGVMGGGVAAAVTPAPAPVILTGGLRHHQRVFVLGDSITALSSTDLAKALRGHYDYEIDGWSGQTIDGQFPTMTKEVDDTAAQDWVVELGTNDLFNGNRQIVEDFDDEVDLLWRQPCVVLVTVSPRLAGGAALNAAIDGVSRVLPTFHVLDWGTLEYLNPSWVRPDHIHPTAAGSSALAGFELRALDACPASSKS